MTTFKFNGKILIGNITNTKGVNNQIIEIDNKYIILRSDIIDPIDVTIEHVTELDEDGKLLNKYSTIECDNIEAIQDLFNIDITESDFGYVYDKHIKVDKRNKSHKIFGQVKYTDKKVTIEA